MRLRNIAGSREAIGESDFVIHEPENQKGNWQKIFGNNNPIHIEIGMRSEERRVGKECT